MTSRRALISGSTKLVRSNDRRAPLQDVHERQEELMATVQERTWLSRGPTGHKVRKVAWGYTLQGEGKQERCFRAEWTRESAQDARDHR